MKQNKSKLSLRCLTEGAVFVALAQVLGYIKLFELPQGGAVDLAMLPIFIFCARWGFGPGILAGFVFGLLQLTLDGAYAWGWQSMLGDYLVAFTMLGLAGLFKGKKGGFLHRHGRRRVCALSGALCRGRDRLGRVYARDLLRHDHDEPLVLFPAL